uniref:Uncharacterized protein n=1 Tax=Riptortus pedestris TaxID=329032 RepID=R4WRA1_RIPPE|nr:conserved hypothetical protein [Riptortus pedestris]
MSKSFFTKTNLLTASAKRLYLSKNCSSKPVETPPTPQPVNHAEIHRRLHPPNNFERRMLVWTGRYKTLEDVPQIVPVDSIEKARNKIRIKVANWMILASFVACIFVSISGKRALERGESVTKMNEDWHKEMNKSKV